MGSLITRNEIQAGQPQYAEPLDANFASLWELLEGNLNDDNIDSLHGSKLQPLSVNTDQIANGAITAGKLAEGAVQTSQVTNYSITNDKLADHSVAMKNLAAAGFVVTDTCSAISVASRDDSVYYRVGNDLNPLTLTVKPDHAAIALVYGTMGITIDPTTANSYASIGRGVLHTCNYNYDAYSSGLIALNEEKYTSTGGAVTSYLTMQGLLFLDKDVEKKIGMSYLWAGGGGVSSRKANCTPSSTYTKLWAIILPREV